MSILLANIFFLVCLVQAMYFSLLKVGALEAVYWFGSKQEVKLRKDIFVNCVFLITFSIFYGLVHFDESYFFWNFGSSKFFLTYLLPAFFLACLGSISTLDLSLKLIPYSLTTPLILVGIIRGNLINSDYLATLFLILIIIFIFF